jgi:hypothetical protein
LYCGGPCYSCSLHCDWRSDQDPRPGRRCDVCGLWQLVVAWRERIFFDALTALALGARISWGGGGGSCANRGAKTRIIGSFKATNTRRALFFFMCVGMSLANNISARFFFTPQSWWSCSATASGSPAARAGDTGAHLTPTPDFFRAISAGECLVVSTVALCGAKPNSLTPWGSVVLPLLKFTICSAPRLLPYAMRSCAPSVCAARP